MLDVHESMEIGIGLGRSESICAGQVSMIELRKQFNTEGPGCFPKLHIRYIRMCLHEI